jgi:hypothetical protein
VKCEKKKSEWSFLYTCAICCKIKYEALWERTIFRLHKNMMRKNIFPQMQRKIRRLFQKSRKTFSCRDKWVQIFLQVFKQNLAKPFQSSIPVVSLFSHSSSSPLSSAMAEQKNRRKSVNLWAQQISVSNSIYSKKYVRFQ